MATACPRPGSPRALFLNLAGGTHGSVGRALGGAGSTWLEKNSAAMQKEQLGLNSAARSALSQASRAVLSLLFGTLRDSRETGRRLCPSPPGLLGLMGG